MSQFPHDDFAKTYLTELLSVIGKARPNRPFKSETQFADLWFELNPKLAANRHLLGLLGQLLDRNSLIEVFRNPAAPIEIRTCQSKFSRLETELTRKARKKKQTLQERDLPAVWLLMPTASEAILGGFSLVPTDIPGIYRFPTMQHMGLIVVHQLPKTPDTLWIRILGREGNQRRAIEELTQHHNDSDLYASIEELLTSYRADLENRRQLTPEDEELIMNLSAAYLQKQQEWKEEGRQEGHQEGHQEGRSERQQEVAIALLQAGVSLDLIAQATGISIESLQKLRSN
jgi:predicted HTH domain antitoxin